MMEEIRRGFKLIRYGYGLKANIFGGIFFFLLGILIYVAATDQISVLGALYIVLGALMVIQIQYSLLYSNFVGASARRKTLEILIADIICMIMGILGYVIIVVGSVYKIGVSPEKTQNILESMLVSGMALLLVFVLIATSYKYYWTSMILFGTLFLMVYGGGMIFVKFANLDLNIVGVSLICLVLMVTGVLLSCVLRRAVYRKMLSPTACSAGLRKAMQ